MSPRKIGSCVIVANARRNARTRSQAVNRTGSGYDQAYIQLPAAAFRQPPHRLRFVSPLKTLPRGLLNHGQAGLGGTVDGNGSPSTGALAEPLIARSSRNSPCRGP